MGEASNVATLLCTLGPSVIYTDDVDYLPPLAVSWAASEPWMGVDRHEAGSRNAWVAWKSLEKLGAATRWRAANCRRTPQHWHHHKSRSSVERPGGRGP